MAKLLTTTKTTLFLLFSQYLLLTQHHVVFSLSSVAPPKKYYGGAGVGKFTLDDGESWQCVYDMVLVERIQGKPKTEGGLFVPQEDLPKLHLCRGE